MLADYSASQESTRQVADHSQVLSQPQPLSYHMDFLVGVWTIRRN